MDLAARPDPSLCPLCGQSNRCAMEVARATGEPQGPCWCTTVEFAPALLDRVPVAAKGTACICARCARHNPPHLYPSP